MPIAGKFDRFLPKVVLGQIDIGGKIDFRRDVLLFLSTGGGRSSPPRWGKALF